MINLDKMCDGCLRMLGDNEKMFGFKVVDDLEQEKLFKGHESCVAELENTIKQLYIGDGS